jgi:hypothetical protein
LVECRGEDKEWLEKDIKDLRLAEHSQTSDSEKETDSNTSRIRDEENNIKGGRGTAWKKKDKT